MVVKSSFCFIFHQNGRKLLFDGKSSFEKTSMQLHVDSVRDVVLHASIVMGVQTVVLCLRHMNSLSFSGKM